MRLSRRTIITGLIAPGILARLIIWYVMPETRFASDEETYYRAGVSLATDGVQDIFLPPSFVFVPLLIICACFFLFRLRRNWHYIVSRHKYIFVSLVLFFAWAWVAWTIFAFSSRLALR